MSKLFSIKIVPYLEFQQTYSSNVNQQVMLLYSKYTTAQKL